MIYYRIKDGVDKNKKPKFRIVDEDDKLVTNKEVLDYIQKLVIPPGYNDVKIFYEKSPKILFQGHDYKGRLQQIYSPDHKKKAMKKKFCALLDFSKVLPKINADIDKYIKDSKFTMNKVISMILKIIIRCGFRLGNLKYQKLYNSFGISTILKSHITMKGPNMIISFVGKKGVLNDCVITDKSLITEMKKLIGKKSMKDYVFTYEDSDGDHWVIKAIEINKWLQSYHIDTTSKHFRTHDVNILFIEYMRQMDPTKLSKAERKKNVVAVMKVISDQVNNSPSICKKDYLHIDLLNLYMDNPATYKKYFNKCQKAQDCFINYLENFCKKK
jgi:DNA topoisomerase-1